MPCSTGDLYRFQTQTFDTGRKNVRVGVSIKAFKRVVPVGYQPKGLVVIQAPKVRFRSDQEIVPM